MGSEALQAACELAFTVARQDAEAQTVDPPSGMRSFLYVAELPRRAISAAQQAVEDDSDFRIRVASRANEDDIGRAGFLWLTRPAGWAQEFEQLTSLPTFDDAEIGIETTQIDLDLAEDVTPGVALDADVDADVGDVGTSNDMDMAGGFKKAVALAAEEAQLVPAYSTAPAEPNAPSAQTEVSEPDYTFDPGDTFSPQSPPIAEAPFSLVENDDGIEATNQQPPPPPAQFEVASRGIAVTDQANIESTDDPNFPSFTDADPALVHTSELDFEADAIENELSSLRGLVSRLASERDMVSATEPVVADEPEAPPVFDGRDYEGEILDLTSDLEAARHELAIAEQDLQSARQEREEAQRQNSTTLQRQVELEKELASIRDQRVEIEDRASASQVSVINLEERLARSESQYEEVARERSVIKSQVDTMSAELSQIREDRIAIRAERDDLQARLVDVEEKSGGQDVGHLRTAAETLSAELEATKGELEAAVARADGLQEQIQGTSATADSLAAEKVDLSSRLADTELALETTTTQHEALRSDSERLAAEVGSLRAERDGLQTQLTELQASLADVLHKQAESRQRNDADRKALNQLRVERDVQLARMADLEKAEQQSEVRVSDLIGERDELVKTQDALIEERGQLRGEAAAAAKDKEQFVDKLEQAEIVRGLLEQELDSEREQREQLRVRAEELETVIEQNKLETAQLIDDRQTLLAGVEELEAERARLEGLASDRDAVVARFSEQESEWNQQVVSLSEQLNAVTGQQAELEQANEALQTEVADLTDRRAAETEVRAKLEQQLGGMLDQQAAFEETRSSLDQELANERTSRDQLEQQIADLESIRADLDQELANERVNRVDLDQELADLRITRTDMEQELADLRSARSEVDEQLADLNVARADLEQELAQERAARSEIEQQLTDFQSSRSGADEELANYRETQEQLDLELTELRLTRDDNEEKLANLQATKDELERDLVELRSGKDDVEQQLAVIREERSGIDVERSELEDQLALGASARDALESRLSDSEAARVDLEEQLAEAVADVDALRLDLESTNRELEESQSRTPGSATQTIDMPVSGFKADVEDDPAIDDAELVDDDENVEGSDLEDADASAEQAEDEIDVADVEDDATAQHPNFEDTVDIDLVDLPPVVDGEPPLAAPSDKGVDFNWPPPATVEDPPEPVTADAEPLAAGESVIDFEEDVDDLDEVSALISQTVTGFNDGDEGLSVEADEIVADDEAEKVDGRATIPPLAPPSIFGEQDDASDDEPETVLSSSGRRQIEIPQDIHEDELAVARYVVASPDVVLLVDGDSVAKLGWPSLPVPQQRDALVTYLAELSASTGAAPDVVFDGRIGDDGSLPASRAVRIRLSTPPTEPAAALDELVDAYPEQWPIALVTDDRGLADSATDRGATVLSNGQLLDLFIGE